MKTQIALLLVCVSCSTLWSQGELRKLSAVERIAYVADGKFMPPTIELTDSLNIAVSIDILYDPFYTVDLWVDKEGNIKRGTVRKALKADKDLLKKIIDISEERNGDVMKSIPVDCGKKKEILQNAIEQDQRIRGENRVKSEEDILNQSKVISLIEQCGFPKKEEVGQVGIDAIFFDCAAQQ